MQNTINVKQTPGMPGDFYDNSPRRVAPAILVTAGTAGALPEIGQPFFYTDIEENPLKAATGVTAVAGGTATFAGVLVNGKELVRNNGLTAGLTVSGNSIGSLCKLGHVWIRVPGAAVVAEQPIYYDIAGGTYTTSATASAEVSGNTANVQIGKAIAVNAAAGEMCVLELLS